jgi:hypothetical protein
MTMRPIPYLAANACLGDEDSILKLVNSGSLTVVTGAQIEPSVAN